MAREIIEKNIDGSVVADLVATGLEPLQARLLALRGVTAATLDGYLRPSLDSLLSPVDLPGVREASAEILAAVRDGRSIVVFGDYDCDGVCATAIMVSALRALGADVKPFVPDRLAEGYGMNATSVERMLAENPGAGLVITVDNGINSVEQVAALKEKGVDVVVTDHHLPGETLPGCTVVNPKVSAPAELDGLCGAGVAFLLSMAVVTSAVDSGFYSGPKIGGPLMVLAGLATVTDIMPLTGQNRILVAEALRRFRTLAPIGLRELLDRASRSAAPLTSRDFGFLIGPRINAAGRIAKGIEALDLVLATDRETARELARRVDLHNQERKSVEQKMSDAAVAQIVSGAPAQVISVPDGHQGVAGIVASRILERLASKGCAVPVCVVVGCHGSARAPEGYNVRDAFVECAEVLTSYGGHAAAGGFSLVREGELERFRELFCAACAGQAAAVGASGASRGIAVDAVIEGGAVTLQLAEWLKNLEPFGEGNPAPLFAMKSVCIADARPLGQDGRHLQLTFRGADMPRAVWWNRGDLVEEMRLASGIPFDVTFTVEASNYGEPHAEAWLSSIDPA